MQNLRSTVRSRRSSVGMLGVFVLVSFLYLGLPVALHPGREVVGAGTDSDLFAWMFAWWPHAVLHGVDPLRTNALWVPRSYNLAWTTSVPALALLVSPVTLLAGPLVAYNLAAVLMPALDAWAAYLLCRHLTGRTWPSLVGGYLFGFSAYVLAQDEGHLNMAAVFAPPLVALVVVRRLDGQLGARGTAVRLGLLLALQAAISVEVLFTLTLALAASFAIGFLVVPERRRALASAVAPVAGGYGLAGLLASPLLVVMLEHFERGALNPPGDYTTDLANLVVPTRLMLAAAGWAGSISDRFPGNVDERDAYLGVPALAVVVLYLWARRRTSGGRFLAAAFAVAFVASLGPVLTFDGRRIVSLPWRLVVHAPLFDNVIPSRLVVYATLAAAVMVALWTAGATQRRLGIVLPALAVLALLPRLGTGLWTRTPDDPQFFSTGLHSRCLVPGESILALPFGSLGDSDIWQIQAGFSFRLAGGYVAPPLAPGYGGLVPYDLTNDTLPSGGPHALISWAKSKGVTAIVVSDRDAGHWGPFLRRAVPGRELGGVLVFPLAPGPETSAVCRAAAKQ